MTLGDHKTTEYNLDNGLKVLFQSYPGSYSATFMIWYNVGSRNEQEGKTGLSHFLEHLSFKRTEFFGKGQIASEITRNGGIFNAYTSRDFTCYYETFSTNKLELAMIIEAQRMNKLILEDEDREKEVGIILSELEKAMDNPYAALDADLREKAYSFHPYKNPIIGRENDIEAITLNDLYEHYNTFYTPDNATIVVVGNFDKNQTLKLIKKHFGSISPGKIQDNIPKEQSQLDLKRIKLKRSSSSPVIKLVYHIPPANNKDIFPLTVLGEMMNLGVSSRIYQSLVESQIATDVNVNVEVAKDPGLFSILATLFPNISHHDAEEKILEEIKNLTNGKHPRNEELEKTKRRIKSSFEFNRDGTFKLAYLLGYYETVDNHKFIDNYIENIQTVSIDDIKQVVDKYLTPSNCSIGYLIPAHEHIEKPDPVHHEFIHYDRSNPAIENEPSLLCHSRIIINEEINTAPIKFVKKELSNGIKVLITENKTSETVRLFGTINAGNLYVSTVNPVLPLMAAGMLNRGSIGRTKIEIANEVESRGASVGISNIGEAVNFSLSSTAEDFAYILNIMADVLMKPSFPEDEFEKYKNMAIASVKHKKDNPGYLAGLAFNRMVYPKDHIYYSHSLRTQEKQIQDITLDEVRAFYETYYSPHTIVLGIAGSINAEETFKLLEEHMGVWSKKEIPQPFIKSVMLQKKYKECVINVENKTETEVIFGHYGNLARNSADFHKAIIMNFIFGGGGALSSRIGKKIREELGLVYSISSSFTALLIPGSWSVRFGVDNHYIDMAIQALKDEINIFLENGVTDNELDVAKSYFIGSYPLRFTNNSGIARALLINEFYELGDNYLNEYPGIIKAITKEEVNEAARQYLHPHVASVVKAGSFE